MCHCRHQRSLVLRLLPHVIRRGRHFLRSRSGPCLIYRGQVNYIWSGKPSFSVSFPHVLTFGATALTDRQLSCYSPWCGHFYFTTVHSLLQAIKNRYWPPWFLLWQFFGEYPSQSVRCSLKPRPTSQTAYLSPMATKQVRNTRCGDLEHCLPPSLDVRFTMFPL